MTTQTDFMYTHLEVPLLADFGPRQWLAAVYADRRGQLHEFMAELNAKATSYPGNQHPLGLVEVRNMLKQIYALSSAYGHFIMDFSAQPEPWDDSPEFMPNIVLLAMGQRVMQPYEIVAAYNAGDRHIPAATRRCHKCRKAFNTTIAQAYRAVVYNHCIEEKRPYIPPNVCYPCRKANPDPKFSVGERVRHNRRPEPVTSVVEASPEPAVELVPPTQDSEIPPETQTGGDA